MMETNFIFWGFVVGAGLVGLFIGRLLMQRKLAEFQGQYNELNRNHDTLLEEHAHGKTAFESRTNELNEAKQNQAILDTKIQAANERIEEEKARLLAMRQEMENSFKSLSQDVLRASQKEFLQLADEKFTSQTQRNKDELSQKEGLIQKSLENMDNRLKDMLNQSTELKKEVESTREETEKLRSTTTGLSNLLASSQKRGMWGEEIVEDIIQYIGLREHINYTKQSVVESGERPDFTFKLPKHKVINLDVKFPIDHYREYLNATNGSDEEERHKKQFFKDVRSHLKALTRREYINLAGGTLDYVMMFIPNESIYGFLNSEDSELIGDALKMKVMLCSPITLYAILSLLHQATSNFIVEQRATEILELVEKFQKQWENFTVTMDKTRKSFDQAARHFDDLMSTRSNALDRPIRQIMELRKSDSQLEIGD
jgi:DNA recombination protein RmuC